MSDFLLIVYPVFYFVIVFGGCKISEKGTFAEEPWGRQQAKMIQAVACIGVVLHHVTQQVTSYGMIDKGPITIFGEIGILFTSLFFFFSGYGLIISVRTKGTYLKNFMWHRMPIILIPFLTANIISVVVRIFYLNIPMKTVDIVKCVLGLVLINGNGWYIVEIFFLYLAFYLIFRIVNNQNIALILLSIVSVILIVIGIHSGHDTLTLDNHWFKGEWWYNSTIVFVMGLWTARFKEGLLSFAKRHYNPLLTAVAILFVAMYFVEEYVRNVYGYYSITPITQIVSNEIITLYAQMALCLLFTWLVLLMNLKITLGNLFLKVIGAISLEMFLLHGIFLDDIFGVFHMDDAFLYAAVFLCGFCAAAMLHFVNNVMIASIHKYAEMEDRKLSEYERRLYEEEKLRKRRKCILCILLVGVVLGTGRKIYSLWIRPYFEYKKEVEGLSQVQVGDTVKFGRYNTNFINVGTEQLEWIVLQKEGNALMLITKEGIAGSVYHHKHEQIQWEDSDIRAFLNDTLYNDVFSKYEQEIILDNPESGDRLSLLSEAEADSLFCDDTSRQLAVTDVAKGDGVNVNLVGKTNYWDLKDYHSSWWWLRGNNQRSKIAPIVTEDGSILVDKKYVNKPNGAVRPVVWVVGWH